MKTTILSLTALLICGPAWSDPNHHHPELDKTKPGYQQFDKLRFLLGEWQGKGGPRNEPIRLWYKLVSGGSSLVETEKVGEEPEMITVYHIDKDRLMLTHYCSANNQPRMHAAPPSGPVKEIVFSLDDVTNLENPDDGHMKGLVLDFQDDDHFSQKWTWAEKGKDVAYTFKLSRKK